MKATLHKIETLTDTIKTFYFKSDHNPRFVAGQFIELIVPHNNPDSRGDSRWFTLSSSPTEELLAITTRIVEKSSSYKKALNKLAIGSKIHMSKPLGDFVLPKNTAVDLLFVAGGIGITPFRSMVKWMVDTNSLRNIQLIISVRRDEDILFKDVFTHPNVAIIPHVAKSLLDAQTITTLVQGLTRKQVYIAGPEKMTEDLVSQFTQLKIPKHQFVTDYFPGYSEL